MRSTPRGLDARVEAEPDAETVVAPYRWLLQRIGDGVKLTQAGYLPPVVVTDAMTELGWAADWIGKGNREDMTRCAAARYPTCLG